MKNENNLKKAQEIIRRFYKIRKDLKELKTKNGDLYNRSLNILPDFVEAYACDRFNLKLKPRGTPGHDAVSNDGKETKYEIKHTILTKDENGKEKPTGYINNLKFSAFDILVVVLLDDNYRIVEVYKIPREDLEKEEFLGIPRDGRKGFLRTESNGKKTLKLTSNVREKLRNSKYKIEPIF